MYGSTAVTYTTWNIHYILCNSRRTRKFWPIVELEFKNYRTVDEQLKLNLKVKVHNKTSLYTFCYKDNASFQFFETDGWTEKLRFLFDSTGVKTHFVFLFKFGERKPVFETFFLCYRIIMKHKMSIYDRKHSIYTCNTPTLPTDLTPFIRQKNTKIHAISRHTNRWIWMEPGSFNPPDSLSTSNLYKYRVTGVVDTRSVDTQTDGSEWNRAHSIHRIVSVPLTCTNIE